MEKQMKRIQGITLIALVVTIVVLLILAAVSINMLAGENGIIKQAQYSKERTRAGTVEERRDLWKSENIINEEKRPRKEVLEELLNEKLLTEEEVRQIEETGQVKIADKIIEFDDIADNIDIEVELEFMEMPPIKAILINIKAPELTGEDKVNIVNKRKNYMSTLDVEEKKQENIKIFNSIMIAVSGGSIPYIKTEEEFLQLLYQTEEVKEKYTTMEELYNSEYKEKYVTYEEFLNNFIYDLFKELSEDLSTVVGIFDIMITKPNGEKITLYSITANDENLYAQMIAGLENGEYKVTARLFGSNATGSNSISIDENSNSYEFVTDKYNHNGYIKEKIIGICLKIDEAYIYIENERIDVSNYIKSKVDYDYIDLVSIYEDVVNHNIPYELELITNGKIIKATIEHGPAPI